MTEPELYYFWVVRDNKRGGMPIAWSALKDACEVVIKNYDLDEVTLTHELWDIS